MPSKSQTMASEPGARPGARLPALTPTRYLYQADIGAAAGELAMPVQVDS